MKIITIFILLLLTLSCGKNKWERASNGYVVTSTDNSQTTPKGAIVLTKNKVTAEQLQAVDTALDKLFADVPTEYKIGVQHSQFKISTPYDGCSPSPEQHVPSWQMRADTYDGTEFDTYNPQGAGVKDGIGVIYAAEMVTDPQGSMVSCPDDGFVQGASVRHGAEHILAFLNDANYYNITWYHGDGVSHPLYPKPQTKSLVTKVSKAPEVGTFFVRPVK